MLIGLVVHAGWTAKDAASKLGIAESTARDNVREYNAEEEGQKPAKRKRGAKAKLDGRTKRRLIATFNKSKDEVQGGVAIAAVAREVGVKVGTGGGEHVSMTTVYKALHDAGIKERPMIQKGILTKAERALRQQFCNHHRDRDADWWEASVGMFVDNSSWDYHPYRRTHKTVGAHIKKRKRSMRKKEDGLKNNELAPNPQETTGHKKVHVFVGIGNGKVCMAVPYGGDGDEGLANMSAATMPLLVQNHFRPALGQAWGAANIQQHNVVFQDSCTAQNSGEARGAMLLRRLQFFGWQQGCPPLPPGSGDLHCIESLWPDANRELSKTDPPAGVKEDRADFVKRVCATLRK